MKPYLAGLACLVFTAHVCVSSHTNPKHKRGCDEPSLALRVGISAAQKTEAKIEGNWAIVGLSHGGKKLPEELLVKLKSFIVFKEGKFLRYRGDLTKPSDEEELSYKIDASKKPAVIDLFDKEGKIKKEMQGIFELDGDKLKIAFGDPRPKALEDGKGVDVLTLKRVK